MTGVNSVIHYLDDFLCVGPPSSNLCGILLAKVRHLAKRFGIPLAADKTEGPMSSIKSLGIVIDSQAMECRLPDDKLLSLKEEVRLMSGKRKIKLREVQSLLGKLNFADGQFFAGGYWKPWWGYVHLVRLNRKHRADLRVWQVFLETFNG